MGIEVKETRPAVAGENGGKQIITGIKIAGALDWNASQDLKENTNKEGYYLRRGVLFVTAIDTLRLTDGGMYLIAKVTLLIV
jgi:hypothetical protein